MLSVAESAVLRRLAFRRWRVPNSDRWVPWLAAAVVAVFFLQAVKASSVKTLWFDEILGITVANAPTWSEIVPSLKQGVDINPPLYHFLTRASIALFGNSPLAARLPAILGMCVFGVALYRVAAAELGRLYGLIAMVLPLCTPLREYAWEARPYGVILGLTGILLVAYRAAIVGSRRTIAAGVVCFALAAAFATHYYAVLLLVPLLLSESVRAILHRKVDWLLLVACVIPLATFAVMADLIQTHRALVVHYHSRGGLLSFTRAYSLYSLPDWLAWLIALGVLVAATVPSRGRAMPDATVTRESSLQAVHKLAFVIGLCALPFMGGVIAKIVTGAFVDRYFLPAAAGTALAAAWLTRSLAQSKPLIAPIVSLCLLGYFAGEGWIFVDAPARSIPPAGAITRADLPIVLEDAKDFLAADRYFSSCRQQIWYLAGPEHSLRYKGFDTDDLLMKGMTRVRPVNVTDFEGFVRRHPHFLLLASTDFVGWNLEHLLKQGAQVKIRSIFPAHRYLFEVNTPTN